MSEELATIHNPGYGARDFHSGVGLWFDVKLLGSSAALICLFGEKAEEVLRQVYDVKKLEGRRAVVERDGEFIHFKRLD